MADKQQAKFVEQFAGILEIDDMMRLHHLPVLAEASFVGDVSEIYDLNDRLNRFLENKNFANLIELLPVIGKFWHSRPLKSHLDTDHKNEVYAIEALHDGVLQAASTSYFDPTHYLEWQLSEAGPRVTTLGQPGVHATQATP